MKILMKMTTREMMKMGVFDFLKRKKVDDSFQEGREMGQVTHSSKAEMVRTEYDLRIQKLKLEAERERLRLERDIEEARQELEDLKGYDEEEESGGKSVEDSVLSALLAKFIAGQQQPAPQIPQPMPAPAPLEISDQQIEQIWRSQDKATQNFIKALDDEQIKSELKERFPQLSDDTIIKALDFVHKEQQKGFKLFRKT